MAESVASGSVDAAALPERCPVVKSIEDCGRWAQHNIRVLIDTLGGTPSELREVADAFRKVTISTAFNDTEAPEVSLGAIGTTLAHYASNIGVHIETPIPECLFAVEINEEAQRELLLLPKPPLHLSADMTSCMHETVRNVVVPQISRMSWDDLVKIFTNDKAVLSTMPCICHPGQHCEFGRAMIHIAGPPCVDWSPQGHQKGWDGNTVAPFLAWIAQRLKVQEDGILHENVPNFKPEALAALLGEHYICSSVILCPTMFGVPSVRRRRYTWLRYQYKLATHTQQT